jgi:predicted MFS family arabinose efflux permease
LVLILRTLQGIAWALMFTAGMTLTISLAPKGRLAQAIGYYSVANLAMNAVAPATAELLADRTGWGTIFVIASLMAGLAFVLGCRLPADRPKETGMTSMWTLFFRPSSLSMVVIVAIWGGAFGAMFIFHQPFALSLGIRGLRGFFIAYTLAAIGIRLVTGNLVDRIGRYRVSVAALCLYAAVVLAMQKLSPGRLELFGLAFGLAHGLFFPAYSALTVERARPEDRGKLMALSNAGFNAGLAVSGIALGTIAERSGYPQAFFAAGMTTLGGVVLLVFSVTPDTRGTRLRASDPGWLRLTRHVRPSRRVQSLDDSRG